MPSTSPPVPGPLLSGKARLAAVLGWPIGHSLSPALHGHWFRAHGLDGVMVPLAVRAEDLAATFRLLPRLGFLGWNVTIPHKQAAAGLVDALEPAAARLGAVNTVLVDEAGRTLGRNTDGAGFLAGLRAAVPGWEPQAGPAVVLGAGGAVRAVAAALLEAGVPGLRLVNRTPERAQAVAALLRAMDAPGSAAVELPAWGERAAALAGAALLVNGTSLGMASLGMEGGLPLDIALDALPRGAVVADLVYTPLETSLLAAARARGQPTVDGLGMLLHQAVPGFGHWGGLVPEVDEATRSALLAALEARQAPIPGPTLPDPTDIAAAGRARSWRLSGAFLWQGGQSDWPPCRQ